jgi:hypothetical protein
MRCESRQEAQPRGLHATWTAVWTFAISISIALICDGGRVAWAERGNAKPLRRATPPAPQWDKGTSGTFFDDAFTVLEGQRPSFAKPVGPAAGAPHAGGSAANPADEEGGFAWSRLVSEGTLTDEIKDMRAAIAAAAANPSDFKGGGYDTAREAFSSIALAFGVIAAHDQDVRWKKDAATARDLFARVSFNCKVGTDQSFNETKARMADLEAMLDGGSPQGKADREEDFVWSQVAGRPALMSRLETAEAAIGAGVASRGDFDRSLERILHDAEVMAVIGEEIQQADFEYHDDDSYRGYAAAMRDAAVKIRDACGKKDYDAARTAAGELRTSCDDCHGDYRS